MIEIVERPTCPTCDGNGRYYDRDSDDFLQCPYCRGTGTVPRTLATFADAAALRAVIELAIDIHAAEIDNARSMLAALGVSDDQS